VGLGGIMWDAVTSHRQRNHISWVIVGCIYVGVRLSWWCHDNTEVGVMIV
jgi:hypothetical protein